MTVQSHLNDVHAAILELIESKRPAVPTPEDVARVLARFDDGAHELDAAVATVGFDIMAASKREYEKQGILPEAMVNFLALLGWSPGSGDQEVFSREELIERFSLEGISGGNAVFNPEKLIIRSPESIIGRGSDTTPARPDSASFASAGPPGYGRPSSVAVLSNASPAASSSVSPISR